MGSCCINLHCIAFTPFWSGPVFCILLGVSSACAQPITGQVTEVTCPVIGRAQPELTPSKRQKVGPSVAIWWDAFGSAFWLHMMTSSNGNIFRVTGHLCGEFTGPRWIPHTKASDAELWCMLPIKFMSASYENRSTLKWMSGYYPLPEPMPPCSLITLIMDPIGWLRQHISYDTTTAWKRITVTS